MIPLQAPAGGARAAWPDHTTGNVIPYRAGFYQRQMVRDGVMVGIRLWLGWGRDGGRDLDFRLDHNGKWAVTQVGSIERYWGWHACCDNVEVHPWSVWPGCSGAEITEDEYRFLLGQRHYAGTYRPDDPFADPRQPVDHAKLSFDFRT